MVYSLVHLTVRHIIKAVKQRANMVLFSDPEVVKAIRNACFGYFKLGGICVSGPMSLLSGYVHLALSYNIKHINNHVLA